ncbi:hypothetical protein [Psychromonas sp. KJ10-2]|uniref:hypothetical protein n=1 Tax=Psychromonas sp. KJ10-2 TaxID=3391822 RepID=UPI0039B41A9C
MAIKKYKMATSTLLPIAIVTMLIGCNTTQESEVINQDINAMSGQEISATFSGKTVQWYWENETGTQTYNADGSAKATRSKNRTKTGKWWVDNDKSCRTWIDYNVGKTTCYQIVNKGDNQFDLYLDGVYVYAEKIIE